MSGGGGAYTLVVSRSEPGARTTFSVPAGSARVVLDLVAAAAEEDPSLHYRYSCRSGYCGTCTIRIDGRPALACRTPVPERPRTVHVAPVRADPVVRDLVADPAPFDARWRAIVPWTAAGPVGPADDPGPVDGVLDCIACGACVAACDRTAEDPDFLGPAALNRAAALLADPRDGARAARLAVVAGPDGVDGCRGIGSCSLACPRGLDPSRSIRRIRRAGGGGRR